MSNHRSVKYRDYINSEEWSRRKSKWLRNVGRTCEREGCPRTQNHYELEPHHSRYINLRDEKLHKDIFILCRRCHIEFHDKHPMKSDMLTETKAFIKTRPEDNSFGFLE